jgi:4-aminobutyrate aminotransferase/(S)-3-amino-2-methylpropionate transaminase
MGYRNFNTWLGDPLRALQLQVIAQTVAQHQLLPTTQLTGDYLMRGLLKLQDTYPKLISNVRGVGRSHCLLSPNLRSTFIHLS